MMKSQNHRDHGLPNVLSSEGTMLVSRYILVTLVTVVTLVTGDYTSLQDISWLQW